MTYLVGKIALDVVAGAPNNAGSDGNVAATKTMRVGRDVYPYVSAQAFRRWLRDSLPAEEQASPVERSGSGKKQQAYTSGRPDKYLDDDLFGYMVAVKERQAGRRLPASARPSWPPARWSPCRATNQRNPTPCTAPATRYRRVIRRRAVAGAATTHTRRRARASRAAHSERRVRCT